MGDSRHKGAPPPNAQGQPVKGTVREGVNVVPPQPYIQGRPADVPFKKGLNVVPAPQVGPIVTTAIDGGPGVGAGQNVLPPPPPPNAPSPQDKKK